ncbi:hypothetical protein F441_14673 [Phytophthora nicotianae CJ01A1]|uniref:RxLR effector protein n=3 Tax=Phytophthora nicotianae TaxID=4792 RepID=W2WG38_PHYNI|nr:hypothetical protein L915_14417 [Phytophthora nicotianae]ETP09461.1 hypothetical protein F441_14673 [Phytophthora nicotianae CJ01A1]
MRLSIVFAVIAATFLATSHATVADQRFLRTNHAHRTTAADFEERTIPKSDLKALVRRFDLDWKTFKVNPASVLQGMSATKYQEYQQAFNKQQKLHKAKGIQRIKPAGS